MTEYSSFPRSKFTRIEMGIILERRRTKRNKMIYQIPRKPWEDHSSKLTAEKALVVTITFRPVRRSANATVMRNNTLEKSLISRSNSPILLLGVDAFIAARVSTPG